MRKFLIVVSLLVLLVSSTMIISYFYDSSSNKKVYGDISQSYYKKQPKDRLKNLRKINEDIIGWIHIPGTKIDYPFVQGEDNDFYLDHDINKEKSKHGSIFMDYRNVFNKDQNLIIHGHHMRDGSMFKDLVNFKEEKFFTSHSKVHLDLEGENQEYTIFAVSLLSGGEDYIKTSFDSIEEFLKYIGDIKDSSKHYREFDFSGEEEILTLSTCSYEFKNARTVIYAVKE